jgi:hypothetical protein
VGVVVGKRSNSPEEHCKEGKRMKKSFSKIF